MQMNHHPINSIATITWHPTLFKFIGVDVMILSEPYKLFKVISIEKLKESETGWLKYLSLDFQTVASRTFIEPFRYPSAWMLQKNVYENPYILVDAKYKK